MNGEIATYHRVMRQSGWFLLIESVTLSQQKPDASSKGSQIEELQDKRGTENREWKEMRERGKGEGGRILSRSFMLRSLLTCCCRI